MHRVLEGIQERGSTPFNRRDAHRLPRDPLPLSHNLQPPLKQTPLGVRLHVARRILRHSLHQLASTGATRGTHLRIALAHRETATRVRLVCTRVVLDVARAPESRAEVGERVAVGDIEAPSAGGDCRGEGSAQGSSENLEVQFLELASLKFALRSEATWRFWPDAAAADDDAAAVADAVVAVHEAG